MSIVGAAKYIPALARGHKIFPQHLAGMLGLPYVGNVIYVDPTAGSDTANSGESQNDALATVFAAEEKTVSGQHDVVIIAPTGGTGRTAETAQIVWDKRFTHLIGSAAPTAMSTRAGMSFSSAVATPSFTVSNNGCIIKNITIAQFNDVESNVLVALTGSRNYFEGVHFAGIGNELTGNDAAARCLELEGAEENRFVDCTFGLDTVTRTAANATVSQGGVCARNEYIGCKFIMFTDAADPDHFKIENNDAAQRYVLFRDCMFLNPDLSSSTTTDVVFNVFSNGTNGTILINDCWHKGSTAWASDFTHFFITMPLPDTDDGGDMVIGS